MKPLVIFLNELSCRFEDVQTGNMPIYILSSINALKAATIVRTDLVLGSSIPVPNLEFGEEKHLLAAVMGSHRLEVRYLMTLARANPWPTIIQAAAPALTEEVRCRGETAFGLTWADKNDTVVLSFGYVPHWGATQVEAERYSIDNIGNESLMPITVPNISQQGDVKTWHDLLKNYGLQEAASSIIHRGDGFLVRMFLNDHEPPHVHIQPPEGGRTLGKLRIDNLEMLDKVLPTHIKNEVMSWVSANQTVLLQSWARCRDGHLPLLLDD